jgi:hypothetical protein
MKRTTGPDAGHPPRSITLKDVRELLESDRGKMTQFMAKYLDPESQASLPAAMGKLFERATTDFYKQAEALLAADGDDSALGKFATRFSKELDKATAMVLEQIAARHALTTRSNLAGRPFEDALEERLITIARPLGDTVERTSDTLGELRRKWGRRGHHHQPGHAPRTRWQARHRSQDTGRSGRRVQGIHDPRLAAASPTEPQRPGRTLRGRLSIAAAARPRFSRDRLHVARGRL